MIPSRLALSSQSVSILKKIDVNNIFLKSILLRITFINQPYLRICI
jgi:hypothetical protein